MSPPSKNRGPAREEPFLLAMVLAAAADGKLRPAERARLREALETVPEYAHLAGEVLDEAVEAAVRQVETDGAEETALLLAESLTDPADRKRAYHLAAQVALVDGSVSGAEASALDLLADALGISERKAHAELRAMKKQT